MIINSILHGFEGINSGQITIKISEHNKTVTINYEDNGIGMPNDKLPSLFEPFYTTKANNGGTGLGTHIIHSLVTDTLNGEISVRSDEGSGLHYTIMFNDMS